MSIPRIIHYCNFSGGTDPDILNRLLTSLLKFCPDYHVVVWDENNFDINYNAFTAQAAASGRLAFVSDVCRLYALYTMGGIYLDTDVEVLRPLDRLLENQVFFGFESTDRICTAVIGSVAGSDTIRELLSSYDKREFSLETNVKIVTDFLCERGLSRDNSSQQLGEITILEQEYLSPIDYATSKTHITPNSYTVHYFNSSWKTDEERMRDKIFFRLTSYKIPEYFAYNIANYFAVMKCRGIIKGHRDMFRVLFGRGKTNCKK